MWTYNYNKNQNELRHHGILGQKWGHRNRPPYPLKGGMYTVAEEKHRRHKIKKNSIIDKRHRDKYLKEGTVLSTLSYDRDRTKNTDMFYAAFDKWDKHQYNALFNKKMPKNLYDADGKFVKTEKVYKCQINNRVKRNMKVASEDSSARIFLNLYKNDRDFYNYVTDPKRMESYFVKSKYKFKGYREGKQVLDKLKDDPSFIPNTTELQRAYRLFNYTIPYDGRDSTDSERAKKDVSAQRQKFFDKCKEHGYGAILDTNDSMYGAYKANAPVIVFDMDNVVLDNIKDIKITDKMISEAALITRKLFKL